MKSSASRVVLFGAGYQRCWDDWQFQANQAELEFQTLAQQKIVAEIRRSIAKA